MSAVHPSSDAALSQLTAPADLEWAFDQSHLFRTYLNSKNVVLLHCDAVGKILWASPSAMRMLGRTIEDLVGRSIADLTDDPALEELRRRISDPTAADEPSLGLEMSGPDGLRVHCDIDVSPLTNGQLPGALVTVRDATRRVSDLAALKASEQRFRVIVNEAPCGIALQDSMGSFVFLNQRMKRIVGTTGNHIIHHELDEFVHPGDLDKVLDHQGADLSESIEIRFVRPDGETRWCSARILPQPDESGNDVSYLWATEDITARVRAEEDQSRLYALMEVSSDLVVILDVNARPLYMNPAARRLLGVPEGIDLDADSPALDLETQPAEALDSIKDTLGRGDTWNGEFSLRSAQGLWVPFSALVVPEIDSRGDLERVSAVLRDVSERKAFEERLQWEATHDPLTDLANRSLLTSQLSHAMERASAEGTYVAIAFLDLDSFRMINESLGHRVGDNLLRQTAEKLSKLVWSHDTVARFGADEFAILMENLSSPDEAVNLAERIRTAVSGRVGMAEVELLMTFSAGVAVTDGTRGDPASLIRDANAALHEAKLRGRDRTEMFTGSLRARAVDRLSIETGLRRALRRDELRLYYQPQVSLETGRICGAEALIRWQHPEHGLIGPSEFISIAEQAGLIIPIGHWVLTEGCKRLNRWQTELTNGSRLTMGVNLSGKQLLNPTLTEEISTVIDESGIDPAQLEIEITESVLLDDVDRSISVLERLKGLGVQLALDDFGTGYSSLTYLRSFPIDVVKIDRSFVDGIGADAGNAAIVASIVELARTLGLRTIAEGVENETDLDVLRKIGCHEVQGFLMSQPLTADDAERFISYDPEW